MKLRAFTQKVAQGFKLPTDANSVSAYISSLRLAGFDEYVRKGFYSAGVDAILSMARKRKQGSTPLPRSHIRTAALNSNSSGTCPKCEGVLSRVSLGELEADYCAGCFLTQPIG